MKQTRECGACNFFYRGECLRSGKNVRGTKSACKNYSDSRPWSGWRERECDDEFLLSLTMEEIEDMGWF